MAGLSIDGINSGLNTTELVDSIINFERRQAVFLENDQALKNGIISALAALQSKFIGLSAQLSLLERPATFEKFSASVSDKEYLTATTSGRVGSGTYDIQVLSLARNHQIASQGVNATDSSIFGTGDLTLSVGVGSETTITIDETNNSLEGIKDAINKANAGITASIINDGSSSNAFRLIISSDKTGFDNQISFTSGLSGGESLNYTTATFDAPELENKALSSTSQISLAAAASYTGSENKIYSFTVVGSGVQTVGSGSILIDWTDGTNSGTISVTQEDTEIMLVGAGADGLSLSFSAGDLTEGDTFEVATFAPLLQEAADAKIAFGSSGGNGSPITVSSETNTFKDVVSGLTLDLKKETEPGTAITVSTDIDLAGIKKELDLFIKRYNEVMTFIDDQNTYDTATKESGVLFGDFSVTTMQSSLRLALASVTSGISSNYNQLATIGIRTDGKGQLKIKDSAALDEALQNNLDDVIKLFTTSGSSSTNTIEYILASEKIKSDHAFEIEITQAATHGGYGGTSIDSPATTPIVIDSSNNKLQLVVDGLISDTITLAEGTYQSVTDLVNEIQSKINADEKIGNRGLTVQWNDNGDGTGNFLFDSNTYGSSSYVKPVLGIDSAAYELLGLLEGTLQEGKDVAGTIDGESATGKGQFLTGDKDNETTDGLKLKITMSEAQILIDPIGTITIAKGVATNLSNLTDSFTRATNGTFDRKINSYKKQVELLTTRVNQIDERLALRRDYLLQKFYDMEAILGRLKGEGDFLATQLSGLNANWKVGR